MSKQWQHFIENKRLPSFPLYLKVWNDSMAVLYNADKKDSILKRGTLITAINGIRNHDLIQQMMYYLPMDGYSKNVNYIRLSSNFPYYHRTIFGLFSNYVVGYIDSLGKENAKLVPLYTPFQDSLWKRHRVKKIVDSTGKEMAFSKRLYHKLKLESSRSFHIDTSLQTGIMLLNTFNHGGRIHFHSFFRKSFREVKKNHLPNLILDLRMNGGGDVENYVLLSKYLRQQPFKVADSVYAITRTLKPYSKYIRWSILDNIGLKIFTKKDKNGLYRYGYWERHLFKPMKKYHFDGNVYVLISGPTFSAATLFCGSLKGQKNVKLIGEEAGGGWYGNDGILIPDIKLPHTHVQVRLPLFRIIQYQHRDVKGQGVQPDIYVGTNLEDIRKGIDTKMETAKKIIREKITE
jgi:hypothetical protein